MAKATNVLVLDVNPASNLGVALRTILESSQQNEIRFQLESMPGGDPRGYAESVWPDLVARFRPAVSFLVSSRDALGPLRSLFQSLRREQLEHPMVVVSDADAPDEMFNLIKLGAADFITPPLTPTGILPRLWRLLDRTPWSESVAQKLKDSLGGVTRFVGKSPSFVHAVSNIPLLAKCDATILISGETGTGKEVCARTIHELSLRSDQPFITVNCGAIPVELVENELFGHERGAYTNAGSSQIGQIQAAEGGTLFLDEIDSLPLLAQVKLLRFLQEKEYKPLGSVKIRRADVRVITATNVNVEKAVQEGKLRQDLYYRLNILPILLPPLRERREDIPLLAASFLSRYAGEYRKRIKGFTPDAMQKLAVHDWPGNIRELEHVVMRAVVLAEDPMIGNHHVVIGTEMDSPRTESFKTMKARVLEQAEHTYLKSLLIAHEGNITRAAEAAQKNRRAFFELLRKHHIDARDFKERK
jgi:two-component system, NtrC family, response regulator GlrR